MTEATEGEGDNIWSRLRRRKVVQWGIAYAAGAWGFLQGLAYVTDTFHWPEQIQQLATPRTADRLARRAGPRLVPRRPRPPTRHPHRTRDPHAAVPAGRRTLLALPARERDGERRSTTVTDARPAPSSPTTNPSPCCRSST